MPEGNPKQLDISHPGKNAQLISPSEALSRKPDFFEGRDANWILKVRHLDGTIEEMAPGTDWEAVSKFGTVRSAVVTNPDGSPSFDRPRYDEAPNINAIAWGKDKKTGEIKIGIISQARPHADNAFEDTDKSMPFYSVPMGFMDKIIGNDQIERLEHAGEAATREIGQETGAQAVLDISYPEYSKHYPNPTFVGTTSDVVFVEVDLNAIDKMKIDRKEQIFKADYVPVKQILADIKAGKTDSGYARMATTNSVILMFLSTLSSFENAEKNAKTAEDQRAFRIKYKRTDPEGYILHMAEEGKVKHPDKANDIRKKLEKRFGAIEKITEPEQPKSEVSKEGSIQTDQSIKAENKKQHKWNFLNRLKRFLKR